LLFGGSDGNVTLYVLRIWRLCSAVLCCDTMLWSSDLCPLAVCVRAWVDRLWFVFLLVPAGGGSSNEKRGNAKMLKNVRKCEMKMRKLGKCENATELDFGLWTLGLRASGLGPKMEN
jgi:hypothetical protein